jgi:hypothetical protein
MFSLSNLLKKKEAPMSTNKSYTVKTTITKGRSKYDTADEWTVIVEGSGFTGESKGYSLSSAFQEAYNNLMTKVSESIFQENQ